MSDFSDFVLQHGDDDTDRLLLGRDKYPGIDIPLAVSTILCRRKLKSKVPSFYAEASLIYPGTLYAEQCSSEETAAYKAELIRALAGGGGSLRIADLTGGLGVDCAAFSRIASEVLYNDMNPQLAAAAQHNFAALGLGNIRVSNAMIADGSGNSDKAVTPKRLLEGFRPDVIFLDPARRSASGGKVFLPQDCSPDIISLKDGLLGIARFVVVKLSPMADVDMLTRRLGNRCRAVEIISAHGECKEVVAILDREHEGECRITANCGGAHFSFTRSEESAAEFSGLGIEEWQEGCLQGKFLLEPDKALMKAAPFNLLCNRLNIAKLDKSTHYYISDIPDRSGLLRTYRILKTAPLNKRTIKQIAAEYPCAEVTARNIPADSDTLRRKLGTASSDSIHIFGLGCMSEASGRRENMLFVCRRENVSL